MCLIFNFCGKYFWPIGKLIWLDKNIFHSRVETCIKDVLCIASCEGHKLWKLSAVFVRWCYQPVAVENYISHAHTDHYALRKKQPLPQRFEFPTQWFRIITAIVQHSILNFWLPYLKFQVRLIGLCQFIRFTRPPFISIYQKWYRYYVNRSCTVVYNNGR